MPSILLFRPHIAENLGSVARVMANFGLSDLRLVEPKPARDDPRAVAAAAGGLAVLQGARVYPDLRAATADLHHLWATTALPRALPLPTLHPRALAGALRAYGERRSGVLFGPEPHGLGNAELAMAEGVVHIPTDPACRALNLAQAVALVAWEWSAWDGGARETTPPRRGPVPAPRVRFDAAFDGIVARALAAGWAPEPGLRPRVVRHLRSLLLRAGPTVAELQTLRGLVETLARPPAGPQGHPGEEPAGAG